MSTNKWTAYRQSNIDIFGKACIKGSVSNAVWNAEKDRLDIFLVVTLRVIQGIEIPIEDAVFLPGFVVRKKFPNLIPDASSLKGTTVEYRYLRPKLVDDDGTVLFEGEFIGGYTREDGTEVPKEVVTEACSLADVWGVDLKGYKAPELSLSTTSLLEKAAAAAKALQEEDFTA